MRFFKRGLNSLSRDHFYFHPWLFLRALGASVRGKKTSLVTLPFDPTEVSHGGTESQRLGRWFDRSLTILIFDEPWFTIDDRHAGGCGVSRLCVSNPSDFCHGGHQTRDQGFGGANPLRLRD